MRILNKTRFLLATTALVAALQAQGMDDKLTTVSQPTRVALRQPQKETTGHLLAFPDGLMLNIAQRLSPEDFVALSSVNKQIRRHVAPVLPLKQAEHLVTQTNKTRDYGNFLKAIETEQGRHIMETLACRGKGLEVSTDTFTQHQDLLAPYVESYSRYPMDSIVPENILGQFPRLVFLELYDNQIDDAGAEKLAGALATNTTLTNLELYNNQIGDAGVGSMAKALTVNTTLTNLKLRSNQIGDAGAVSMAEALKVNTTLTTLDLSFNQIGAEGGKHVAEALKVNATFTTLFLSFNQIGDAGAVSMAEPLKVNTTLTTLDLSFNQIGAEGGRHVAEALKVNTTLTTLDLRSNQIGAEGGKHVAEALKVNTTLTNLNLVVNEIGDVGGRAILEALRANQNSNLKKLVLFDNGISNGLKNEFRALAEARGFKVIL